MKNIQKISPIFIAFGANLSNPKSTFQQAIKLLSARGVTIELMSGLWQSPAWPPGKGQPDYINACARIGWGGNARSLLNCLHEVEAQMGRVRGVKNAARVLDLDLLDFRAQILGNVSAPEQIIIPHPRMLDRGFVLFPLSEIAPDWTDPCGGVSIDIHLAKLPLKDVAPMQWLGPF